MTTAIDGPRRGATSMQVLEKFKYIVRHAHDYARQWKETHGRPVIGTFCSYAPDKSISWDL